MDSIKPMSHDKHLKIFPNMSQGHTHSKMNLIDDAHRKVTLNVRKDGFKPRITHTFIAIIL